MKDCDIARDLMPLVIDSIASRESEEFVKAHVASCVDCEKAYKDMCCAPPAPGKDAGAPSFRAAMRALRRSTAFRAMLIATLCVLAAAALLFAGLRGYDKLFNNYSKPLAPQEYAVTLRRTADGFIYMNAAPNDTLLDCSAWAMLDFGSNSPYDKGEAVPFYVGIETTVIPRHLSQPALFQNLGGYLYYYEGELYITYTEGFDALSDGTEVRYVSLSEKISEIRKGEWGGDIYEIVYRAGDDIPLCTPEEEEAVRSARDVRNVQVVSQKVTLPIE